MFGSSHVKRWTRKHAAWAVVPLVATYLAVTVFSASAGVCAAAHVLEPIERASSDLPTEPYAAVSLGGDHLP